MSQQLAGFIVIIVIVGSLVWFARAKRRGHGPGGGDSSWLPLDSGDAGAGGHHGHHHGDAGHGGHDAGGFDGGGGGHH